MADHSCPSARLLLVGLVAVGVYTPGCDAPEEEPAPPAASLPSDWHYVEEAEVAPPLDPAAFGAALDAALVSVLAIDPALGLDLYDRLTFPADLACPWYDPTYTAQRYWEDDCETEAGVSFYGWTLYNRARSVRRGQETCADTAFLYGFGRIDETDGESFVGYGELSSDECVDNASGAARFDAVFRGAFRDEGGSGTWLSDPLSLSYTLSASDGADGRSLAVSGSVSGLAGALPALYLHDVVASDGGCALEPAGWIWAMDENHTTYTLTFDDVAADDAACDGCGALTAGGVASGSACVDTSPLLSWEARPWG